MADVKTAAPAVEGENKKRRGVAKGTKRTARPLNLLLTVNDAGDPALEVASYNSQDILKSFMSLTQQGKKAVLAEWVKPATETAE